MVSNAQNDQAQGAALAIVPKQEQGMVARPGALQFTSMKELIEVGTLLSASGYFQDATKPGQAVAKMLAGRELGIQPLASMTGIYLVQGRVTLGANLIAAQIKKSTRYSYRVLKLEDEVCEIVFTENGQPCGTSVFTKADAEKASLWNKGGPWKQFPRNMLYARAMSNGARWFCPDVFSGPVYTPDELGAEVQMNEQGELLQVKDVTPNIEPSVEPPTSCTQAQVEEIRNLAQRLNMDEVAVLSWLKVEHWQDLPAVKAAKAIAKLRGYVEAAEAKVEGDGTSDVQPADPALEKLVKDLGGHLDRLQTTPEQNKALDELILPEHEEGVALNADQCRRLITKLRSFKTNQAVTEWISMKRDEIRYAADRAAEQVEVFPKDEMQSLAPERTEKAKASDDGGLFLEDDDVTELPA